MLFQLQLKTPKMGAMVTIWIILLGVRSQCKATKVPETSSQLSTIFAEATKYFLDQLQIQNEADHTFPETRGGWGHGGGGHGAITLDPVSIISLLALGAFLINNILQLLRANMNGGANVGRSLDNELNALQFFPFPPLSFNSIKPLPSEGPSFTDFFGSLGSLYYLQPKKRHMCMKRVVCNYMTQKESREDPQMSNPLKTKIFDFMITTVAKIVAPEEEKAGGRCQKAEKFCNDELLKDARVSAEFKVYSQVSSWLTKLAFNGLAKG